MPGLWIPDSRFAASGMTAVSLSARLMPARLYQVAEDGCFAELLAGFQAMQTLHQHQAFAVTPDQDRRLLTLLQHALGDLIDNLGVEAGAPFGGDVDAVDREGLALHHAVTALLAATPA